MFRFVLIGQNLAEARRRDNALSRQRRKSLRQAGTLGMTEREFVQSFRLSHHLFDELMIQVGPLMRPQSRIGDIHPQTKVLTALHFFATGGYQTAVGTNAAVAMSQPSVCRAVKEVTEVLNLPVILSHNIKFPQTMEERSYLKIRFDQKTGIPSCIGCIDGSQVALVRPREYEERFFNRKWYHSKNVQIICDVDLNITSVDASYGGASHDSFIWNAHPVKAHLEELNRLGEQVFLLGDSGYAQRSFMMVPILNAAPQSHEEHYSTLQKKARSTVERCIGVLKSRWRCLLAARELHYDPETVGRIVNACVVLHNMCNKQRIPHQHLTDAERRLEEELQVQQYHADRAVPAVDLGRNPDLLRGRAARANLVHTLWERRRIHGGVEAPQAGPAPRQRALAPRADDRAEAGRAPSR